MDQYRVSDSAAYEEGRREESRTEEGRQRELNRRPLAFSFLEQMGNDDGKFS